MLQNVPAALSDHHRQANAWLCHERQVGGAVTMEYRECGANGRRYLRDQETKKLAVGARCKHRAKHPVCWRNSEVYFLSITVYEGGHHGAQLENLVPIIKNWIYPPLISNM